MSPEPMSVWVIDVDVEPQVAAGLAASLDDEERLRATSHSGASRRAYEVSHGALRHVLGSHLGVPADSIRFGPPGVHGRPELAGDGAVSFNLSHSGTLALVAVSDGVPVGVDVERHTERRIDALANRSFSEIELDRWQTSAPSKKAAEFHRYWCRKEAVLKATGRGIASLRELTATPTPPGWTVADLAVGDGYSAAVALPAAGRSVAVSRWTPPAAGIATR